MQTITLHLKEHNGEERIFAEFSYNKEIQEHENGRDAKEICRELQITTAAFYKWRQRPRRTFLISFTPKSKI